MLAQNASTCIAVKIDGSSAKVNMHFNVGSKIKRVAPGQAAVAQAPVEFAYKSNLEEPEPKVVHKDKWPIPLATRDAIVKPSLGDLSKQGG